MNIEEQGKIFTLFLHVHLAYLVHLHMIKKVENQSKYIIRQHPN